MVTNDWCIIIEVKFFNLIIHLLSAASCVKILIMSICDNGDVVFVFASLACVNGPAS